MTLTEVTSFSDGQKICKNGEGSHYAPVYSSNSAVQDVVIECVNVSKHFKVGDTVHQVFKDLNLEIKRGTIFSLLGPSGCGKTTLLKCIVGRLLVDQGVLKVFGGQPMPGHLVGYMPQAVSLLDDLTVRETLWLFGRLGKMDKKRTRVRMEFMLNILGMSSHIDMPFKKLSGGQQRRVAFACALLNEAPLLILDEPTVGVDPILRRTIWEYLRTIVKQFNITVIITTHYIEEARNSQTVGMFLEGRLLAVSAPETLIQTYNCANLEDVFLKLSLSEITSNRYKGEITCVRSKVRKSLRLRLAEWEEDFHKRFSKSYKESFDIVRLIELTRVNCLCYSRHRWAFFSALFLPAFIFWLLPFTFNGQMKHIKMAVVNQDKGDFGQAYIDSINVNIINTIPCGSYEEGLEGLRNGTMYAVLWFKQNFSSSLKKRFTMPLFAKHEHIIGSTMYAALDYYNQPFAIKIMFELQNAFTTFTKQTAKRFNLDHDYGKFPIEFLEGISEKVDLGEFRTFFMPGFMLLIVFFVIAGNLCVINVALMEIGYYDRLYTAGASALEVVLSQALYQILIAVPQLVFLFFVIFNIDGIICHGSYTILTLLALLNYLSGIFLGLFVSGVSANLHMAAIMLVVIVCINVLLQGIVWPLEGMDEYFRIFCQFGPFAQPAVALRNIINKGMAIGHGSVYGAFAVSTIWSIINFLCAWISYWLRK